MKTYLLTGGAGFIGSHLVEAILNNGDKVVVVDNFNNFYNPEIKKRNVAESTKNCYLAGEDIKELAKRVTNDKYKLEYADIRDEKEIERIFSENNFDMVINLAAMAGVRPSLENPLLYEEVNVKGFMILLEECKKRGIKKFVQASSSSVYGNSKTVPFKESDIVDFAISPYAATKKSGEVMGHVYYSLYNIDMIQLRFFTVYGPRQRPDLAINKFTKLIDAGEEVPFYGDGSTERDYTFIADIIDGITKSINYLNNNSGVYEILNLGESRTITLTKMVSEIERAVGKKANLKKLPMQPGDVLRTNADISKAKKIIGYNTVKKFEDGIEKFMIWYKNNK